MKNTDGKTEYIHGKKDETTTEQEYECFYEMPPRLPDGLRFFSCDECQGLHTTTERCLVCNAPLFDQDNFCANCGQNVIEMNDLADGYCSHCYHKLFSGTALDPEYKDYTCPGCNLGSEDGAKFKFRTPELRAAYREGKGEDECTREVMTKDPKERITKIWQVHAVVLEVPTDWEMGERHGSEVTFRTSVTQKVKNIEDIIETVDAKLEFQAMKARKGYHVKGCSMDMTQSMDPIASGHEILTTVLDRVAEPDYTLACWE